MPFPLVMLEIDGTISWYNTRFKDMMEDEDILNENIEDLLPKIKIEDNLKTQRKSL